MNRDEEILRALVAALPEAFAGQDLDAEYGENPDGSWLVYIAWPHALRWIDEHALAGGPRPQSVTVTDEDALGRYLGLIDAIAADGDGFGQTLLWIEAFACTPWLDDVLADRRGYPHLERSLRAAQDDDLLNRQYSVVGRWQRPGRS